MSGSRVQVAKVGIREIVASCWLLVAVIIIIIGKKMLPTTIAAIRTTEQYSKSLK